MIDKSIFNINYANKKILLRIDISCPIYDNKIIDEYRLHLNLPFIQLLLENGCSLIILSNNNDNSLELVSKKLQELLPQYPVNFINENSTEVVSEKCVNLNNEILVLENVEFNKDDLVIKEGVVKFWSSLCDYYVFDALNQADKKINSIYGMMKYYPDKCFYGQLISEEFNSIDKILTNSTRFNFIIGGTKLVNKVNIINKYSNKIHKLIVGGALSFEFLKANSYDIGRSYIDNRDTYDVMNVTRTSKNKIVLPKDFVCVRDLNDEETNTISIYEGLKENIGCDIGEETIRLFKESLVGVNNVVFFSALGMFELNKFAKGTVAMLDFLKELTRQGVNTYIMSPDLIMCAKANGFKKSDFTCFSDAGNNITNILQGTQLPGLLLI